MQLRLEEDKPLIFLVEDSPGQSQKIKTAFKQLNVNVELCNASSQELILDDFKLESQRPDLVLLDVDPSDPVGLDVLDSMKTDDDLRAIPVLVLSTFDNSIVIDKIYNRFANGYIGKSDGFDDIVRTVKEILEFWFTYVKLPGWR